MQEARRAVAHLYGSNSGEVGGRAAPAAPERPGGRPLEAQRRLLRDRQAAVVYAIVFVEGAAFFGGLSYLGALLHDKYGLSLDEVGLVLVLDGLGLLVTSRLLGRIAPRLGENRMILTGALFIGGAYLLVLAVANWQAVVPAAVLLGAGFALCHSTLQTRASELAPEARATAISLFALSLFVGSAVGTAVLGQLVESRGYGALLLSCGVALALVGVAAPRLTAPAPAASQQVGDLVAVLRLDECQDRLGANTVVFHRLRRLLRLECLLPVRDVRDVDDQPDPIRSLRISKSAHRHSARPEEFLSLW
jgi:MFS family permease